MTYVEVQGASRSQARVLGRLFADIESVLGLRLRVSGTGRAGLRIFLTNKDADDDAYDADWLGYYCERQIYIRPFLRGRRLYGVALHELGHFWGLEHTKSGILAAFEGSIPRGRVTLSHRRRLLREMSAALTKQRLRQLSR